MILISMKVPPSFLKLNWLYLVKKPLLVTKCKKDTSEALVLVHDKARDLCLVGISKNYLTLIFNS